MENEFHERQQIEDFDFQSYKEQISQEKKENAEKTLEKRIPVEELIRVKKLPYKLPKKLAEVIDGFKWAIKYKKQSAVIVVDGRSGMGKTTLSSQIAKYMSPNFGLHNIHFTPEKFLDALTKTKKGDTIIFDEAMLLSSRAALTAMNRMIVIAMSMIRSKNLLIIFNVNSIFDLDKNLALSRADLLLHCYGDSLTDKGKFLAFFKGSDGHDRIKQLYINGKKYYSYSTPKSNFNTTFSPYFTVDDAEYNAKKDEGVNKFLKGTQTKTQIKDKLSRDKYIHYLFENRKKLGITQEDIAEIGGIGDKTVYDARVRIQEMLDKEEELKKHSGEDGFLR